MADKNSHAVASRFVPPAPRDNSRSDRGLCYLRKRWESSYKGRSRNTLLHPVLFEDRDTNCNPVAVVADKTGAEDTIGIEADKTAVEDEIDVGARWGKEKAAAWVEAFAEELLVLAERCWAWDD